MMNLTSFIGRLRRTAIFFVILLSPFASAQDDAREAAIRSLKETAQLFQSSAGINRERAAAMLCTSTRTTMDFLKMKDTQLLATIREACQNIGKLREFINSLSSTQLNTVGGPSSYRRFSKPPFIYLNEMYEDPCNAAEVDLLLRRYGADFLARQAVPMSIYISLQEDLRQMQYMHNLKELLPANASTDLRALLELLSSPETQEELPKVRAALTKVETKLVESGISAQSLSTKSFEVAKVAPNCLTRIGANFESEVKKVVTLETGKYFLTWLKNHPEVALNFRASQDAQYRLKDIGWKSAPGDPPYIHEMKGAITDAYHSSYVLLKEKGKLVLISEGESHSMRTAIRVGAL